MIGALRARRPRRPLAQMLSFAAVGAGNTAIDVAVFVLITLAFGWRSGAGAAAASTLGFLCGAGHSYAWNSRWTFGRWHRGDSPAAVGAFLATVSVGAGLTAAAFAAVAHAWPGSGAAMLAAAKAGAIAVGMGWNFLAMRHWVFAARRATSAGATAARLRPR